jgi:hypothetical protein
VSGLGFELTFGWLQCLFLNTIVWITYSTFKNLRKAYCEPDLLEVGLTQPPVPSLLGLRSRAGWLVSRVSLRTHPHHFH